MSMWDPRFAEPGYAYGTEPNDFLAEVADRLPRGRALCVAEGQGRNAVFLAGRGYDVLAVDLSAIGLARAEELAAARGVRIETKVLDLAELRLEEGRWDVIVSIFAHVPPDVRRHVHAEVVRGLAPGGAFVLEAYSPDQLAYDTGGPRTRELLVSLDDLRSEIVGLRFEHAVERERDVVEGRYHTGRAAVVQLLAYKP